MQLPKKERRPCPEPPASLDQYIESAKTAPKGSKAATELMIQMNTEAFSKFDTEALV